eukprot:TRINITY_DN12131_c0_g1_i1.p1 TRINITY_DN12131_c0_g1~~TRINITY_DN12131_c0_g1_i1.p1  ORF type:complete len:221 (-),score=49.43 TRINITY_DN12131_c0_g1_i1:159-821(-)
MAQEIAVEDLRRPQVTVRDYMSKKPICLLPDMLLIDAAKVLLENNISGAPVVQRIQGDEVGEGKLIGILTEEDLMWKEINTDEREMQSVFRAPYLWPFMSEDSLLETYQEQAQKILSQTVGLSMSGDVLFATPDMLVKEAARVMLDARVKRLPVLAPLQEAAVASAGGIGGQTVVGVISREDVLRHVLSLLRTEEQKEKSEPGQQKHEDLPRSVDLRGGA